PELLLVCCPVTKGTFWPTIIEASWLSNVKILGVESRFTLVVDDNACKKPPHRKLPRRSNSPPPIKAPSEIFGGTLPSTPAITSPVLMPAFEKLVPPYPLLALPAAH